MNQKGICSENKQRNATRKKGKKNMKKNIIAWITATFILAAVAVCVAGCQPRTPGGPAADFRADVTSGSAPLTVRFTDLSAPGSSPITSWSWLFGDGAKETSAEQDPVHTYTAAGTYNVSLTVTTANGEDTELKLNFISVTPSGEGEGEGEGETILLPDDVPLEMVWIPAGSFMMGRYPGELDSYADEDPQHSVTLSLGFWMGKYELTKAQWTAVMGTIPWGLYFFPNYNATVLDDPNSPAVSVSWNDAQAFITALNTFTGKTFRLPSEAEWEYACRAGTTTRFYWGDDPGYTVINIYSWWEDNARSAHETYAHVVGQKLPNTWGLYDMSGNVWEWCQDWYVDYSSGSVMDPTGPETGDYRVLRGGSWSSYEGYTCRSATRDNATPDDKETWMGPGFRIVRTP